MFISYGFAPDMIVFTITQWETSQQPAGHTRNDDFLRGRI
jgi:hypothetical protein